MGSTVRNLSIQKIISILLHRIKFIVLVTLISAVVFFLYSKFLITPTYSASSMVFVQNYSNSETGANKENQKIYSTDMSGSATLAKLCVTLFKNSDEMTALYNGCNVNIDVSEDTFFITFTVTGDDAQKCANVANQLSEKAEEVYKGFFVYGQIGTIREAQAPTSPISPDNLKITLIGFVLGFAVAAVISVLLEIVDATIKPDDDLQQIYDLPVFAEIPDFENQG